MLYKQYVILVCINLIYTLLFNQIHYACNEFGIRTGAEHLTPLETTLDPAYPADHPSFLPSSDADGVWVAEPGQSWSAMRTMLLSNCVLMAREQGDVLSAARLELLCRLI